MKVSFVVFVFCLCVRVCVILVSVSGDAQLLFFCLHTLIHGYMHNNQTNIPHVMLVDVDEISAAKFSTKKFVSFQWWNTLCRMLVLLFGQLLWAVRVGICKSGSECFSNFIHVYGSMFWIVICKRIASSWSVNKNRFLCLQIVCVLQDVLSY